MPLNSLLNSYEFSADPMVDMNASYQMDELQGYLDEKKQLESEITEAGGTPMPDSGFFGGLASFFDTLDTFGQYARGGLEKAFGAEDYANLGWGEAMQKANDANLTVGDMFKRHDILQGEDWGSTIARTTLGFVGDVATDPISWIAPVGGFGKKIGGKVVTKGATKLEKELIEQGLKKAKPLMNAYLERLPASARKAMKSDLEFRKLAEVQQDVAKKFARGGQALDKLKEFERLGGVDLAKQGILKNESEALIKKAAKDLGLQTDTPVEALKALYVKPSIKLISPFGGLEKEIPGLTKASEKLYEALGGKLYNASLNLKGNVQKFVDVANKSDSATAKIGAKIVSGALKMPTVASKLFSRKARAGSLQLLDTVDEHVVAKAYLRGEVAQDAAKIFEGLSDDSLIAIRKTLDEPNIKMSEYAKKGLADAAPEVEEMTRQNILNQSIENMRQTYNAQQPGLGDKMAEVTAFVRKDFDAMGAIGQERGFLTDLKKDYVHHLYENSDDLGKVDIDKVREGIDKLSPGFTKQRAFENLADAEKYYEAKGGRKLNLNVRDVWENYSYSHRKLLNEQDFWERLAYEQTLSKETYDQLTKIVATNKDETANKALNILKANGFDLSAADVKKLSKEQIEKIFPGTEFEMHKGVLGRAGEDITTRAGASLVPEQFKKILRRSDLDPEDKQFFTGLLPEKSVRFIKESLNQKNTLSALGDWLDKSNFDPDLSKAVKGLTGAYLGGVKILKAALLAPFPAYHARNLWGGQFQNIKATSVLGEALNPLNLVRNRLIMHGKADLVTNTGKVYKAKELKSLMNRYGLRQDAMASVDILNGLADTFNSHMKRAKIDKKGIAGRAWAGVKDVQEYIENFGREHAFVDLLKKGYDPASAAKDVNRVMIDYGKSKTPFEQHFLNNIFFFYTFGKGEAANSMAALIQKPGALTAQLHGINAAKELLKDPTANPPQPDLLRSLEKARSDQGLSRFLGWAETGDPIMLAGTGMPGEEVLSSFQLKAPQNILNLGDWVDSAEASGGATLRRQISRMNPVLRFPLEIIAARKNMFFNRSIDSKNMRRFSTFQKPLSEMFHYEPDSIPSKVIGQLDNGLQKFLKAKDNGNGTFQADPFRMALITYFVPGAGRLEATGRAIGKEEVPGYARAARALTGFKPEKAPVEWAPEKWDLGTLKQQLKETLERQKGAKD